MRRVLTFAFLLLCLCAGAQQLPQYTQYTFNEVLINPAVTGIESFWDVKSGYRNQWSGLEGSPKTTYVTVSIPLNSSFTKNDYSQGQGNTDNPMNHDAAFNYESSKSHPGIGFSILSDKTGQIGQTHFNINYAYHIQLNDSYNLAVGAAVGVNNISLNTSQITVVNTLDPILSQGNNAQYKPEAGFGVWFYGPRLFVGLSGQQLVPNSITFSKKAVNTTQTYAQYFLTTGYRAYISEDVTVLPSVVIRPLAQSESLSYDVNMKLAFRDYLWIGGAYRHNDAMAASFGFNVGSFLSIGYSYDYTTSDLNIVSGGTHELMLGLMLNNYYRVSSPRHTW